MTAPLLGIGQVPVRSWWLRLADPTGSLLWEGIVDALYAPDDQNKNGLNITRTSLPMDVQRRLSVLPSYQATWEPAWEQVDAAALPSGTR